MPEVGHFFANYFLCVYLDDLDTKKVNIYVYIAKFFLIFFWMEINIFFCVGWPKANFFLLSILKKIWSLMVFWPADYEFEHYYWFWSPENAIQQIRNFLFFYTWKDFNIIQKKLFSNLKSLIFDLVNNVPNTLYSKQILSKKNFVLFFKIDRRNKFEILRQSRTSQEIGDESRLYNQI